MMTMMVVIHEFLNLFLFASRRISLEYWLGVEDVGYKLVWLSLEML